MNAMTTWTRLQAVLLLALPLAANAEIYRCETPNGIEFTDTRCDNAEVVKIEDTTSGVGPEPLELLKTRVSLEEKKLQREQQRYRDTLRGRRDSELTAIDDQIAALRRLKTSANNNLAGATYGAGIDQQIAALQQARADVMTSRGEQITRAEFQAAADKPR